MMHARHQGTAVHSQGIAHKVSAARTQAILSRIPRDETGLIGGLNSDWKAIEQGIVTAITAVLRVSLRIHGHGAITEDLPLLLQRPAAYADIAHQSYIKNVTTERLSILTAAQIRQLFSGIELSDDDLQPLMRRAVTQVKRTPDEPKLIVVNGEETVIITFAQ